MSQTNFISRRVRELSFLGKGLLSTKHVVLAHIVPMRRCNLACTYCNEYDKVSDPVPLDEMKARIDKLAYFKTSIITISGGEPMMHPEIYEIIAHIRSKGIIAGMISNGYYFTPAKIQKLNDAGLEHLQISIDNVDPDDVSKKSLKLLDKKLKWLSEHAAFHININSVLGSGVKNPDDALEIAKFAVGQGFTSTVGVIHDGMGLLKPLNDKDRATFNEIKKIGAKSYARFNNFQKKLVNGEQYEWRCRAGARYLYICEDGLVHWCSQQRGTPGIALKDYTWDDYDREYNTEKWCAKDCTIQCVHQVALLDNWRDPQISLGDYNKRNGKGLNKDTVAHVLSAK
jgi:MoaA/NifB/PqqE/SkfB family radical SAM enzyme